MVAASASALAASALTARPLCVPGRHHVSFGSRRAFAEVGGVDQPGARAPNDHFEQRLRSDGTCLEEENDIGVESASKHVATQENGTSCFLNR